MMTLTQSVTAKAIVAFVAAAMVFSMVAPLAKADTTSDLQAQIAALMAQIEALRGMTTSAPTCAAIPAPLKMGSTGVNVTSLQNYLISAKNTIAAGATGYFGGQTKAALAAWQSANGVMPAVGYYGPITAAAMSAKCTAVVPAVPTTPTTTPTTTPPTTGTGVTLGTSEGSINQLTQVSADDTVIREGQTTGLLAFEAKISGDLSFDRVDVYMQSGTATSASTRIDRFFNGASLMADGKKVATLSTSDFVEDYYAPFTTGKSYRLRFTGLGLVYKNGQIPRFQVALAANTVIDSNDRIQNWTAKLATDSIRTVDGKGFTGTDGNTSISQNFGINSKLTAQLSVTKSVNSPTAATIEVSKTQSTQGVAVGIFDVREKSGVNTTLNDVTFTVTATNTVTDESVVARTASIWNGSTMLASKSVPSNGVVLFQNMNLAIPANGTVPVTIKLDFAQQLSGMTAIYPQGETVYVAYTSIQSVTDANGNADSDISSISTVGPVNADVHALRVTGLNVVSVSNTATQVLDPNTSANNYGNFTMNVDVTAFGDSLYIPLTAARTSGTVGVVYQIQDSNGAIVSTGTTTASLQRVSGGSVTGSYVQIGDGSTARFTLQTTFDPTVAGQYRVQILSLGYDTTAVTPTLSQLVTPATDFQSANVYVTN